MTVKVELHGVADPKQVKLDEYLEGLNTAFLTALQPVPFDVSVALLSTLIAVLIMARKENDTMCEALDDVERVADAMRKIIRVDFGTGREVMRVYYEK